ncbi:unnamed protein product [Closterium sp. Yama58-4]|nr:unnamed protein product [Closterium sp. Yama58-4]
MPRIFPFLCSCEDEHGVLDEGIARCQLASDFLIALAYFSIPLELVYFFLRAKVFPHRWVLLQFGLFIVLCGLTHLVNMWTYGPHPSAVALLQTVLKVLCAAVSCATAFLLITIIPALLNVKVRELFLQHKAAQLDREMDVMRRKEEVGRHVRMLTYEIRQSLDRHTLLNTILVWPMWSRDGRDEAQGGGGAARAHADIRDQAVTGPPHPPQHHSRVAHVECMPRISHIHSPTHSPTRSPTPCQVRELFLQHKAAQLDREMDVMRRKEEVGRHVRMLTYEIRQSLDRHTLLNTILVWPMWSRDGRDEAQGGGGAARAHADIRDQAVTGPPHPPQHHSRVAHVECMPRISHIHSPTHSPTRSPTPCQVRELFLQHKAAQLDREMDVMRRKEEVGRHVRMLTYEIRQSLDRHTLLNTTLVELAQALMLENCTIWMPHPSGSYLEPSGVAVALSHAAVLEETQRRRDELEEKNRTLQAARQRAEVAVMARNDFLAVMNHEMRTPLHSITALASILNEEDLTPEQAPMVATVLRSASLLTSLITDVLDFSRQEESLHLEKRPFDLHKLCREAGKLAWPLVRSKGLRFSLEVAGVVPRYVVGDEKRLLRLMLHLIGRAVKKTDEGFVSVRVSVDDGRTPRPHSSQSSSTAGDGPASSSLPAAAAAAAAAGENSLGLQPHTPWELLLGQDLVNIRVDIKDSGTVSSMDSYVQELEGVHVLLVEDNVANRIATHQMLLTLRCHVSSVGSAQECQMELTTRKSPAIPPVDVVLLDVCMPDVDGFEVARRIHSLFR